MRMPAGKRRATAALLSAAAAMFVAGEPVAAQDDERSLNSAIEVIGFDGKLPDRPKLVGDSLIWADHALVDLCAELRGTFRKLAGRSEYTCRLSRCTD